MKNNTTSTSPSALTLERGQTWQLSGSHIDIGLVGKRLVHYKHFKTNAKRASNSITAIHSMQSYLENHNAVLRTA